MRLSKAVFRRALGRFATGVTVVTVARGKRHVHGMTANAFASVSLDPLLVLVCVDRRARTHPLIRAHKRFGINVLAENQRAVAEYYARRDQDHEAAHGLGVRYWQTKCGTPMLEGCMAHLDCRLVSSHRTGDHTIFIGEVEQVIVGKGRPLLFYAGKYRRLEAEST